MQIVRLPKWIEVVDGNCKTMFDAFLSAKYMAHALKSMQINLRESDGT